MMSTAGSTIVMSTGLCNVLMKSKIVDAQIVDVILNPFHLHFMGLVPVNAHFSQLGGYHVHGLNPGPGNLPNIKCEIYH